MERGKLNCFFIDTELKWGKYNPSVIFMNTTEDEFNELWIVIYLKLNLTAMNLILTFLETTY